MNDSDRYFYEITRELAELEDRKDAYDQKLRPGFQNLLLKDPEWDKWLTEREVDNRSYQRDHENG